MYEKNFASEAEYEKLNRLLASHVPKTGEGSQYRNKQKKWVVACKRKYGKTKKIVNKYRYRLSVLDKTWRG